MIKSGIYKDHYDDQKIKNNLEIYNYDQKYLPNDHNYLILDGISMGTTSVLISKGISKDKITVVENNLNTYFIMKDKQLANVYFDNLENYIKDTSMNEFATCFFDFMGHVEGSKSDDHYPLESLDIFLKKTNAPKLVMAFTFSLRGSPNKGLFSQENNMTEHIGNLLENNFKYNQFEIIDKNNPVQYKRKSEKILGMSMVFLIYVLQKNYNINPNKVEFAADNKGNFYGYRNIENSTNKKRKLQ